MFGRMLNETLGKIHFWFTFVGVYCIFMPMHFLGLAGHPRRYADTTGVDYLATSAPGARVHHHRGDDHHRRPASVCAQFLLEPESRQEGQRESVERHHAGVVGCFAAAVR